MTEKIYTENIRKILKERKEISSAFKVKLSSEAKVLIIEGEPEQEVLTLSFVEAVDMGFPIIVALDLKNEDYVFKKISIKSIAQRNNLSQVRARVIGRERKAMDNFEYLTGCNISLHDNWVGIIGQEEMVRRAEYALKHLIAGSNHSKVYSYLEKEKAKEKDSFY